MVRTRGAVEQWLEHVGQWSSGWNTWGSGAVVRTRGAVEQWLEHVGRWSSG